MTTPWKNDTLQFARLLTALHYSIDLPTEARKELRAKTGLEFADVLDVFERAENYWERAKESAKKLTFAEFTNLGHLELKDLIDEEQRFGPIELSFVSREDLETVWLGLNLDDDVVNYGDLRKQGFTGMSERSDLALLRDIVFNDALPKLLEQAGDTWTVNVRYIAQGFDCPVDDLVNANGWERYDFSDGIDRGDKGYTVKAFNVQHAVERALAVAEDDLIYESQEKTGEFIVKLWVDDSVDVFPDRETPDNQGISHVV